METMDFRWEEICLKDKAHACAQWVSLAKTFLMHQIAEESTEKERNPFSQ